MLNPKHILFPRHYFSKYNNDSEVEMTTETVCQFPEFLKIYIHLDFVGE